jgi:hypothetical protein
MKKRVTMVFLLSFLVVSLTALHVQANPPPPTCPEGCTPGYWKNHTDSWVVYSPEDLIGNVFGLWDDWFNLREELSDIADYTLLEALNFKGGPGIEGAAKILLRSAVAALLNASHPDIDYSQTEELVLSIRLLFSADENPLKEREDFIFISGKLEGWNELLCPLD